MSMIETDAFFMRGSDLGCLLIHGFSGNPGDLRSLADALAGKGYTVDLPLLPGHGPTPEGNGSAHWRDWASYVAERHAELRQTCRSVVVVGFSMGGSLAIYEAAQRPPAGLVVVALPTFVDRDWRAHLVPVAKYFIRWWYPFAQANFNDPTVRASIHNRIQDFDLDDPGVQAELRRSVRIPTAAIDHFMRITRRARKLIPKVAVPTLIVQGRRDRTALPMCAEEIYRKLASGDKEIAWFDNSGHQIMDGPEGSAVVERVVEWIAAKIGIPELAAAG